MKRQLSVPVKTPAFDYLFDHFRSVKEGMRYALDSFAHLHESALKEIRGLFSRGELYLIIEVFEGLTLKAEEAGNYLRRECCTEMDIDRLDVKWKIDRTGFQKKLKALTGYQAAAMEIWASSYWYGGGEKSAGKKSDRDLEEHMKVLL